MDLVLNGDHRSASNISFDGPLRDAVQERARRDAIRSLHLWSERKLVLVAVLAALTPANGQVDYAGMESISLRLVDASKFLARCRFPNLLCLRLSVGTHISNWEHIASHTTALTTLEITVDIDDVAAIPTTSQLLSLLASNPHLQDVTLTRLRADPEGSVISPIPQLMRHLEKLTVEGDFCSVLKLVEGLDYPRTMDELTLIVCKSRAEDVVTILAPLARDHVEREGRRRTRLGLSVKCYPGCLSIQASAIDNTSGEGQRLTFASFIVHQSLDILDDDSLQMSADFIAQLSVHEVVHFGGDLSMDIVERVVPTMPRIQELHLIRARLEKGFLLPDPKATVVRKKLLPSLRHLYLEDVLPDKTGWKPLLSYLAHQTADGERISVAISVPGEHMCNEVIQEIWAFAEELAISWDVDAGCPFKSCVSSVEEEGEEEGEE